jgi:hypothetical protein
MSSTSHDAEHLTPSISSLSMEGFTGGLLEAADADVGRPVPIDEMKTNDDGGSGLQSRRAEEEQQMEHHK